MSPFPLDLSLPQAVDAAAERWPDQVGWVFEDTPITFEEMRERSLAIAAAFRRRGVESGDVIAAWLPNVPSWAYAFFGAARLGALFVSLNTRWTPDEAAWVLDHCRAKFLVYQPRFLKIDLRAALAEMRPSIVPQLGGAEADPGAPVLVDLAAGTDAVAPRIDSLLDAVAEGGTEGSGPEVDPSAPVLIQYTSGSTAKPKGAVLSHRHVLNFGLELTERMGVRTGEAMLNTQPVYHVGGACGSVPVPLGLGCKMVIPEYYSPRRSLELIEREKCVARTGMSTMYVREIELPEFGDFDTSTLRCGWVNAPPGQLDRIRDVFSLELVQLYGSSEGGVTIGDPKDPWEIRRISAGAQVGGYELAILDPDTGERLGSEEIGEICFRGWARLLHYIHDEEATRAAIDADGWYHSQDLGRLDGEGRLYYEGRLKEMIKPGGENVSASEVEAVLAEHPAVAQVAVVGVPDDDLGEAVLAAVELVPGSSVEEDELKEFSATKLARFRVPRHIRFPAEMPVTDSGKLNKRVIRERCIAELAEQTA